MAYKVKSFGMEIRPLKTMTELKELDEAVNKFAAEQGVKRVISVSDTSVTNDQGVTIGLIRAVAYED